MQDVYKTNNSTRADERAFWIKVIDQALGQYERSLSDSDLIKSLLASGHGANGFFDQAACSLIWAEATRLSDDPLFGLRLNRLFRPTPMDALILTCRASPTVAAALENLCRFFAVVSTQVKLVTGTDEQRHYIKLLPQGNPHVQHIEAITGYLCQLVHQLDQSEQGLLTSVSLVRDNLDMAHSSRLINSPELVISDTYYLNLERTLLNQPLPSADEFLLPRLTAAMQDLLASMPSNDLVEQVKRHIHQLLGSGELTEERIAVPLNISPRHLRRKLNQEGTSYEQLVDEVRRESAIRMIIEGNLTWTRIAYEMCILDPSSFTRAFRRWTGMSPTAFREQFRKTDASTD